MDTENASRADVRRPSGNGPVLPYGPIDGKYEVRGVLGEGGTGIVYDAIRTSDGAAVALKVMHPQLAGDKQIRGRFQREAAILRRLEGSHICPILEAGEVASGNGESLLYMALPKLDGPTLEHLLATDAPIDVARGLDVMLQICLALRTAHAQGVIHRDLKPANVILEGGKKAVVVDFGMSKIVTGGGLGTTNLTAHNMVFGTPEYMSPEQARGEDLDARCDVYAAGIMLYEMLTGAPPFTGTTPLSVLTEHLTSTIEPPSQRAKDGRVTPALESVVMHALARDRDRRYPSASALGAAIMHARAVPNDTQSLQPGAFATSPEGTDAFAITMPTIESDLTSDTLLAAAPLVGAVTPKSEASSPPPTVSAKITSRPPPRASVERRPEPVAAAPPPRPVIKEESTLTWIVLWVVAALASIGVGVYFALR